MIPRWGESYDLGPQTGAGPCVDDRTRGVAEGGTELGQVGFATGRHRTSKCGRAMAGNQKQTLGVALHADWAPVASKLGA